MRLVSAVARTKSGSIVFYKTVRRDDKCVYFFVLPHTEDSSFDQKTIMFT